MGDVPALVKKLVDGVNALLEPSEVILTAESSFSEFDSLHKVEILLAVEELFVCDIPDEDVPALTDMQKLGNYLYNRGYRA